MGAKGASQRLRLVVAPWVGDLVLALALAMVALLSAWGRPGSRLALQVAVPLVLVWRRRAPLAVAGAMSAVLVPHDVLMGDEVTLAGVAALLIVMYSVAAYEQSLTRALVGGVVLGVAANTDLIVGGLGHDDFWPFRLLFLAGVWLAGWVVHRQRRQVGELTDQAVVLAREREERAAAAVAQERARLARELHDVVAHSVSVMVVQAGAAEQVLAGDPERARAPLQSIQTTGRQTVVELRRLLGILREGDHELATAPQPSLGQLDGLVADARDAGVAVSATVEGTPRSLPPSIDLSAYRIVQEGLTNVIKHAGHATAQVLVRYTDHALELQVTDDGPGSPDGPDGPDGESGGHGLLGVRERVALFGGSFQAGNRAEGGFGLRALLPLDEVPR
jgi:signal transduction histidine kinase